MPSNQTVNINQQNLVISVRDQTITSALFDLTPTVVDGKIVADTKLQLSISDQKGSEQQVIKTSSTSLGVNPNPLFQNNSVNSLDLKYTAVGTDPAGGPINIVGKNPNIFFNIKRKTFSDKKLIFSFNNKSLGSGSSATDTWTCDSNIKSDFSLVGDSGCLVPHGAFGHYFYELLPNKIISNNTVKFSPTVAPSYTVLVFAVANQYSFTTGSGNGGIPYDMVNLLEGMQVHKFMLNETFAGQVYTSYNCFNTNYGLEKTPDLSNVYDYDYTAFNSVFTGNTLNAPRYMGSINKGLDYFKRVNMPRIERINTQNGQFDDYFRIGAWHRLNQDPLPLKQEMASLLPYINISNLPTSLANPTTPQQINISGTVYPLFNLFFVEMFSVPMYKAGPNGEDLLMNQTFINRKKMIEMYSPLTVRGIDTSPQTYLVSLANKFNYPYAVAPIGTYPKKLFLFNYTHGLANSSSEMYSKSKTLIESLAYDFRGFLVKNSSDLQLSNSSASLNFPYQNTHPFLNMYFNNQ